VVRGCCAFRGVGRGEHVVSALLSPRRPATRQAVP
jgi:hypothetical protein